jgi:hypothetical protein
MQALKKGCSLGSRRIRDAASGDEGTLRREGMLLVERGCRPERRDSTCREGMHPVEMASSRRSRDEEVAEGMQQVETKHIRWRGAAAAEEGMQPLMNGCIC